MTPTTSHLLAREREELEAVVSPLREGRRVVAFVVCTAKVRPMVIAHLREKSGAAIPDAVVLADPYETLTALTEVAGLGQGEVRSLLLDHAVPEVMRTLNWHREKLRRGGSVLLWVDGIDGLRALRAVAPDAYSFRDVMVVVQAEQPVLVVVPVDEPIDLQVARRKYALARSPEERAEVAVTLAETLQIYGSVGESRDVARCALGEIPRHEYNSGRAGVTRAELYSMVSDAYSETESAEAFRTSQLGIHELKDDASPDARVRRLVLLATMPSPLGVDDSSALRAIGEMRSTEGPAWFRCAVLGRAAQACVARGELPRAAELLREARALPRLSARDQGNIACLEGELNFVAGRFSRAEDRCRESSDLLARAGSATLAPALLVARCLRVRGEQDTSRRALDAIGAQSGQSFGAVFEVERIAAELQVDAGHVVPGLADLRANMHKRAADSWDRDLYDASVSYVSALSAAHDAGRLTPQALTEAEADLDVAEAVALSIARDDPPWYTILYPGLRAELYALQPERLSDAIALATAAVARARAVWTDAAPMHARRLVAHLVRAHRFDDALAALAVAEPEAAAPRHLRELARLRALAVAVLVQKGAPAPDVEAKVAALRATLDETGSPRIVAETLLELSRLSPPDSSTPEPLDLLDEAYALFVEMPYPAQEARCLEVMGDVLAARGDRAGARPRYLAAKGTCERYGLGLRVPLLTSKLGDATT